MSSKHIVRSDDLRSENRSRVLSCLRKAGRCHPTEIAQKTGLSAASISSLNAQLTEQNIVANQRSKNTRVKTTRGRPQLLIELNADAGHIISVNVSIDLIHVQRINYVGKTITENSVEFDSRSASKAEVTNIICKSINSCNNQLKANNETGVQLIGIACQGVTDNSSGTIIWTPIFSFRNFALGTALEQRFNIPVNINNNCALIAEALYHGYQHKLGNSFATLVFSHGVGLSLFIDDKPFNGVGSSAMELGHLPFERNGALCRCGKKGCIEAYAADYGIERLVNGESLHTLPAGRVSSSVFRQLFEAAENKEESAVQAFAIAGAAIGEGLSTLFTLCGPMPVALVGRDQRCLALMNGGIRSALQNHSRKLDIDELLHRFDNTDPLQDAGLTMNTLSMLDQKHAHTTVLPAHVSA